MAIKTLTLAVTLAVAFSGAAFAQTPAGGGSAEGNMNSPGSVKSESQKMEERGGTMSTGAPGTSGGPPVSTPGAAAGSGMGNGTTGSGAAPSGK
ncbi:hypothetical protein MKK52_12170 [Methylobacterium sp. J-067]|jgi:hypothetical protein|nr:hypothetical protein [Methylobacterium sp. J-067]MCJ2024971.1 hypothetical protein [Methylobacterium sp. J-067]